MKIACNWSPQLKDLLDNNKVDIDYIKCGLWDNFHGNYYEALKYRPVLIHGLGYNEEAGMSDTSIIDFDKINEILYECKSPHYGLHLGIQKSEMDANMDINQVFDRMTRNIQLFKNNLNIPLLLENIHDCVTDRTVFDHYPFAESSLINDIISRNDVGFLLDLSHSKTSAIFNNWDIKSYIESLPLDRIKEIHVNGTGFDKNGNIADVRAYMKDEEYELLEWILTKCSPEIVTLEYIGLENQNYSVSKELISKQLNNIKCIINSLKN